MLEVCCLVELLRTVEALCWQCGSMWECHSGALVAGHIGCGILSVDLKACIGLKFAPSIECIPPCVEKARFGADAAETFFRAEVCLNASKVQEDVEQACCSEDDNLNLLLHRSKQD